MNNSWFTGTVNHKICFNRDLKTKRLRNINLPHLIPNIVGQAPWSDLSSFSPFFFKLYQNAKDPFFGNVAFPRMGKPVPPPSTSESCKQLLMLLLWRLLITFDEKVQYCKIFPSSKFTKAKSVKISLPLSKSVKQTVNKKIVLYNKSYQMWSLSARTKVIILTDDIFICLNIFK